MEEKKFPRKRRSKKDESNSVQEFEMTFSYKLDTEKEGMGVNFDFKFSPNANMAIAGRILGCLNSGIFADMIFEEMADRLEDDNFGEFIESFENAFEENIQEVESPNGDISPEDAMQHMARTKVKQQFGGME